MVGKGFWVLPVAGRDLMLGILSSYFIISCSLGYFSEDAELILHL
jgi:hypothetical protein